MKRINYKLNKDEDCLTIMFMLKHDSKTRNVSIIHSENLEHIDTIKFN